jgi:hypothetical protein
MLDSLQLRLVAWVTMVYLLILWRTPGVTDTGIHRVSSLLGCIQPRTLCHSHHEQ